MSQGVLVDHESFRATKVIWKSYSIFFDNFSLYLPFYLILTLLSAWSVFVLPAEDQDVAANVSTLNLLNQGIVSLFSFISYFAIQAILFYAVIMNLRGVKIGWRQALLRGGPRFLKVIWTSGIAGLLIGIGFLFFLIPGVILSCVYAVTVPVAVVEKRGVSASLKRSRQLTKNRRWKILLANIGLLICAYLVIILCLLPVVAIFSGFDLTPSQNAIVAGLVGAFATPLLISVSSIAAAYQYYLLTNEKEGVDLDSIAAVFG